LKGVFDINLGSKYDNIEGKRYHFPTHKGYLPVAEALKGEWVLFRESKRERGRKGYVGAAQVVSIDPLGDGTAYAHVTNYFEFDPVVALKDSSGEYREGNLRDVPSSRLIGRTLQGHAVRPISDEDFSAIVSDALGEALSPANLIRYGPVGPDGLDLPSTSKSNASDEPFVRRLETALVNRKVRDANFRRLVCRAYNDTCAVTGLRIINGGGRSEVQAAHIWSVAQGGPDVVTNGLALSGTIHWLFDRHLISLSPEYRLLVADNRIPTELRGLFPDPSAPIHLPKDAALWPNPEYVERHREAFAGQ
jgi:putative restriction endonuclease